MKHRVRGEPREGGAVLPPWETRDIIRQGGAKGGSLHPVKVLTGSKSGTSRKSARSQCDIIRRGGAEIGNRHPVKVLTGSKSGTSRKSARSQCDIIRRGGAEGGSRHPVKVLTGSKYGTSRKSARSQCDIIRRGGAKGGGEPLGGHGCPPHFAEYETPQNVSKDRVSLSLRPSVVPWTA